MRIIAITNRKGGTGKTTTAVNLGAALAERGRRVLVVDLDAQANTTRWLDKADKSSTLLEALLNEAEPLAALATAITGLEVVAAGRPLAAAERVLAHEVGADVLLRKKLQTMDHGRWDYALLDCPPSFGILAINAWIAARELVVPVEAHMMAVDGLVELLEGSEQIRKRVNPDLRVTGIVACRLDSRTRHGQEMVQRLRTHLGSAVFDTAIRENIRLAEAYSFRQPITVYDTKSAGAQDYRALAGEVEARGQG